MEPDAKRSDRRGWIALGALGIAALAALAVLLDLGPFADEPLSEAEFLARGDEICRQAHADFEKLQGSPPATASEAGALAGELAGISRDELDAVRDLDAPAALEPALERYLRAREVGIAQLRTGVEAAGEGDSFAYSEAQAKLAAGQPARARLAERVGFKECGRILFGRRQLAEDAQPPAQTDPGAPPTVSNPPTATP